MNILITAPALQEKGGVGRYYKSILPYLKKKTQYTITVLEIGSQKRAFKVLHVIMDRIRFWLKLAGKHYDLICINPSLNIKCTVRDGLFMAAAGIKGIPVLVFVRGWNYSFEKK